MPLTWLGHDLPDDAVRQLQRFAPSGLQAMALAPNGGWVMVARAADAGGAAPAPAAFAARGIPDACFVCLRGFLAAGHAIRSIAFASGGAAATGRAAVGWVVVTDQQYAAAGIPDDCFVALVDGWAGGLRPSCLAFAPPAVDAAAAGVAAQAIDATPSVAPAAHGAAVAARAGGRGAAAAGPAWALLAGGCVLGRGIDAGCWQRLRNLAQGLRPARQLALAPDAGWAIVSDDGVWSSGLPAACSAHLGQIAQAHVVEQACLAPNGRGWLVGSSSPKRRLPVDPLHVFERQFRLVAGHWRSLGERMASHRVGSLGVATAVDGRLAAVTFHGLERADDRDAWRRAAQRWLCASDPAIAGAPGDRGHPGDAEHPGDGRFDAASRRPLATDHADDADRTDGTDCTEGADDTDGADRTDGTVVTDRTDGSERLAAANVADDDCRVQRWTAVGAACAVRAAGGDAAGRAALLDEVVDALARVHGWPPADAAARG